MSPDTTDHSADEYRESSGRVLSFGARVLEAEYTTAAVADALAQLVRTNAFTREELLCLRALPVHRKWQLAAGVLKALQIDPLEFVHDCLAKLRLSPECLSDHDWATIQYWLTPHAPRTTADA